MPDRSSCHFFKTRPIVPSSFSISMAPRRPLFQYSPLPDPTKEIRVLELLPSWRRGADIICNIRAASIRDPPEYRALSYFRGGSSQTRRIVVNGSEFWVGRNLESALRQLRRERETSTLWVDAICINQNDKVEKSPQVILMSRIYLQAYQVVVWLGELGVYEHIALTAIEYFMDPARTLESPRHHRGRYQSSRCHFRALWQSPSEIFCCIGLSIAFEWPSLLFHLGGIASSLRKITGPREKVRCP